MASTVGKTVVDINPNAFSCCTARITVQQVSRCDDGHADNGDMNLPEA